LRLVSHFQHTLLEGGSWFGSQGAEEGSRGVIDRSRGEPKNHIQQQVVDRFVKNLEVLGSMSVITVRSRGSHRATRAHPNRNHCPHAEEPHTEILVYHKPPCLPIIIDTEPPRGKPLILHTCHFRRKPILAPCPASPTFQLIEPLL